MPRNISIVVASAVLLALAIACQAPPAPAGSATAQPPVTAGGATPAAGGTSVPTAAAKVDLADSVKVAVSTIGTNLDPQFTTPLGSTVRLPSMPSPPSTVRAS